jgi:hypothetical protein
MSTIHGLQLLAVDLEQRVVREMQFTGDAEQQVADAFKTLREALNHVENVVMNTFQERSRALAATLGNGTIQPETVEAKNTGNVVTGRIKSKISNVEPVEG